MTRFRRSPALVILGAALASPVWLLPALGAEPTAPAKADGASAQQAADKQPDAADKQAPNGNDPAEKDPVPGSDANAVPEGGAKRRPAKDPPGMKRLMPEYDVWIDPVHRRVVMDGTVCLREGQLEMFACPRGTKEHEAIVAVDAKAYVVHAALLAIGAEAGGPVQFQPSYKPASGSEIDIGIVWTDKQGVVHRDRAQDWILNTKTNKPLEYPWVFGGSGFWKDDVTGEKYYLAESGDFICVSNFSSAMLDLPVESSQANDELLFQAYTDRIPPIGTRVRVVLTPKAKADEAKK